MGLFGIGDSEQYLHFTVHLTDPAAVVAAQHALAGATRPTGMIMIAPGECSVAFNAPMLVPGDPFVAPCVTSEWFGPRFNYPTHQRHFVQNTGWWIFNSEVSYYWVGDVKVAPGIGAEGPDLPTALTPRRWIDGAELPPRGDGGSGTGDMISRGSSRHLDGYGYSFRNTTVDRVHSSTESGLPATAQQWERFYVRFRQWPTAATQLWRTTNSGSPAAGVAIHVSPTGTLVIYGVDNGGAHALIGTSPAIPLNTWTRIDLVYEHSGLVDRAAVRLFINGVWALTLRTGGLNYGGFCSQSSIGGGTAVGLVMDIDDWIGADWPTHGSFVNPSTLGPSGGGSPWKNFPGLDWRSGSRVQLIQPKAFAASHDPAWIGDWSLVAQRSVSGPGGAVTLTPGARFAVATDADVVDTTPQIGAAALWIARYGGPSAAPASLNGSLDGGVLGLQVAPTVVPGSETITWFGKLVSASPHGGVGVVQPVTPLAGLELGYENGDPVQGNLFALQACAELLGTWGAEDAPPPVQGWEGGTDPPTVVDVEYPRTIDQGHNNPYPRSVWAQPGPPPPSPVYVKTGTYVGDDLVTTLTFEVPVHFIVVRPVSGGTLATWFSSMNAPHVALPFKHETDTITIIEIDPSVPSEIRTIVKIPGTNAHANAAGVTYQYLAFGDPGMRFLLCGMLRNFTGAGDFVSALANEGYTPEAGFFAAERMSVANAGGFFKGLGHAADAISRLNAAAEIPSALRWANGTVTTKAAFHTALVGGDPAQVAYALWRRSDGNGNPDEARVLQLATYVGDGSASRTVGLSPPSGRRPLYAWVVPHDAGGTVMRDPSHTGTESTWIETGGINAAGGITGGGIDTISVGANMNVNGVGYEVFVIPGDTVAGAGANGWSGNGEFFPVAPDSPVNGPWDDSPVNPEIPDPPIGGTPPVVPPPGPPGGPFPFPVGCVAASTMVINTALSRLGISKQIVDLLLEQTQEATVSRLHYLEDVAATLRDFPWPFATRYARLVWHAGTPQVPVNGDWQYAYLVPPLFIFARRIVNPSGSRRGWDPHPIPFRLGGDDTVGELVYCNLGPTDVEGLAPELEYTVWPNCAALAGDSIFRSALAWRHAHSLAPALSRDEKKVVMCWTMYLSLLNTAAVKVANESQKDPGGDAEWIAAR